MRPSGRGLARRTSTHDLRRHAGTSARSRAGRRSPRHNEEPCAAVRGPSDLRHPPNSPTIPACPPPRPRPAPPPTRGPGSRARRAQAEPRVGPRGRRHGPARGGVGAGPGRVGGGQPARPAPGRAPRRHPPDAPQPGDRRARLDPPPLRAATGRAARRGAADPARPPLGAPDLAFDLRRGNSLVEFLLAQGRTVYVVTYDAAFWPGRRRGLETWVDDVVPAAVARVCDEEAADGGALPRAPRGLEPRRAVRAAHRGGARRPADRLGDGVRRARGRGGGADRGAVPVDRRVHRRAGSSPPPTACSAGSRRPRCVRRSSSSASTATSPSRSRS